MKKFLVLILIVFIPFLVAQDVDWKVKCEGKVAEIEEIIGILNPVVEYLTEAFDKNTFTEITSEEWADAVVQFTHANGNYDKAKAWMVEETYNKKTFLKLEEAWQYYVKTGVAGIRAKGMVDSELGK
jgi:hypothetical protein